MDENRQEQASSYALGALPEDERVEFEQAMARDPELKQLVGDFHNALAGAAMALPKRAPSAALKSRVLQRVAAAPVAEPSAKVVRFPTWIPWAAAAGLAVTSGWLYSDLADLRSREAKLSAELGHTRTQTESLRAELARAERAANLAELRVARLASQLADQPGALAVSLWNDSTQQGVLVVENLALPPPGKTYQLWVLDPTTQAPIDAGIFTTDAEGRGRIIFRPKASVNTAAQFAVSLEQAGGAPSPQGPIVMIGATTRL